MPGISAGGCGSGGTDAGMQPRCARTARRCCAALRLSPGGGHRADYQPVPAARQRAEPPPAAGYRPETLRVLLGRGSRDRSAGGGQDRRHADVGAAVPRDPPGSVGSGARVPTAVGRRLVGHQHGPGAGRGLAGSAPFAVEHRPAAPYCRDPRQPDRPGSAKPNTKASPAKSKDSRSASPVPTTSSPRSTGVPASPSISPSPQSRTPPSPHPTGHKSDFAVIMLNIRVQATCCIASPASFLRSRASPAASVGTRSVTRTGTVCTIPNEIVKIHWLLEAFA
jgi:hypothetical protein